MKHLIYLDHEYLYSYYAQAFDGIDTTTHKETQDSTQSSQTTNGEKVSRNLEFNFEIPRIAKLSAGKNAAEDNEQACFIETEAVKEAISISLHDNALSRVIQHSNPVTDGDYTKGDYVILRGNYTFADIKSYVERLSDSVIKTIARKNWQDYLAKQANPDASAIRNGEKAFISKEEKKLQDSKHEIEFSLNLAQLDIFILMGNAIIPIKRNYLRESSAEVMFKYDSDIFVFGRVTRINKSTPVSKTADAIHDLNSSFIDVWPRSFKNMGLLTSDEYAVISPLAIYFE